jgi:hypothetical protein
LLRAEAKDSSGKGESMARSIVVFATSHRLQGAQHYKGTVNTPSYSKLVNKLISDKAIDFIFEEASGTGPTTAQNLAGSIRYLDIDSRPDERNKHGLPVDSGSLLVPIDPSDPTMSNDYYVWEYVEAQEQRENFWLRRIEEQHFSRGLLICGFIHLLSFSFRLKLAKFDVESLCYVPYHRLCGHGEHLVVDS